jgi:hypothetical protein
VICLHCGDCCTRFEIPEINKPAGVRCQYLSNENLCLIYDSPKRPDVCYRHDYPANVCPIGLYNTQKMK